MILIVYHWYARSDYMGSLLPRAKITQKMQITMPKVVCDTLSLKEGDYLSFNEDSNGKIFIEKDQDYVTCFGCHGTGRIDHLHCIICGGEGKILNSMDNDFTAIMGNIMRYSLSSGVRMTYTSTRDNHNNIEQVIMPRVTINGSGDYSSDELLRIQDEVQKRIIRTYSVGSINGGFAYPADSILNEILDTLSTSNAKAEVLSWFRSQSW